MSHGGQEKQGTGLGEVFDILVKTPPERLLSLTFQLGESPVDNIVHALCLLILHREAQALDKLQMLSDNNLARHLAEKWQKSGGKLEDFGIHCGEFQEFTWETLAVLARIFKVLSDQRLCDPHLRDLAYKRALSCHDQKANNHNDLKYDQLREEAKVICGPHFTECSTMDVESGSYCELHSSRDELYNFSLSSDQSEKAHCLPSPLQASSSVPSYPTHLEISLPPTAPFQGDRRTPDTSSVSKPNTPVLVSNIKAKNAHGHSRTSEEHSLNEPPMFGAKKLSRIEETFAAESSKSECFTAPTQTTKPTTGPNVVLSTVTNTVLPKMPLAIESTGAEEEEEAIFYAFVILHAPEDADLAESMREKLETVIGSEGATFSGDFETPGKSTLTCVEDAINNTAFTILLLTRNFNSHMQEIETNSALINSINKKHKYNTVIPLLPQENRIQRMPLVLQTIVPLEENKSFDRKIQKALSPAMIKRLRKIWTEEQMVKKQLERQERLKQLNQRQKQLMKEHEEAQLLERENLRLLMTQTLRLGPGVLPDQDGGSGMGWWQQHPNIHIENARYIMIGNDSQMTVDLGGGAEKDDSVNRTEEQ